MNLRDFRRAGHAPTLFCSFLYFDVSFMVWVLLGALANSIIADFGLSDSRAGMMVSIPLLGGSCLRPVLGVLADRVGAQRTALLGLALTVIPILLGWLWADNFAELLVVGALLGVAGASFAAALPLASRWYPPEYQGLVMGIAGAGNSGTALATFFGPRLAESIGWHGVFGLALIPLGATMVLFYLMAQDSPNQPAPKRWADYASVLRQVDAAWFCLFYAVTFGGFVGLASFLAIYFREQFHLTKIQAGSFATVCVIAGSFLRPLGGFLADRFGGVRVLSTLYVLIAAVMLGVATSPPLALCTLLLFTGMALLGMGNGSVFQLVPQRFPREIGVLTGVVGAAGGLGGFVLPNVLGSLRQVFGTFAAGFGVFALAALGAAFALRYAARSWQGDFLGAGGVAITSASDAVTSAHEPSLAADIALAGAD